MYCRLRPPLSTNKRSGSAEATGRPLPLQLHASLTMTQQGSVFRDAAGTQPLKPASELISSDPELVVSKRTFLSGSCQDIHFKEGPGSFRRPFPSAACLSFAGLCCTIGFPSRGQVLSLSCHSLAQQRESSPSLGPQDWDVKSRWCVSARLCSGYWEMTKVSCSHQRAGPSGP